MTRARRARLLLLAVVLGLVAVACIEPQPVSGNKVLVVGDSLMNQARDEVAAALQADGWDPTIEAEGGTTIVTWSERFLLLDLSQQPNMIVIELGTNDCGTDSCPDLDPYIDRIMKYTNSADQVLWLNVNEDHPLLDRRDYVNDEISSAVSRFP